ncbi:hypothetical protein GTP46_24460 [Duganella sp. FT135W]|uniref:Carbohydrate-binding protein n=1 Tax=Duganella flavida TaxID=2692175 RepID=A0A6L8KFB7_9BURK|nr:hypothetical protein [Duganella flavida]MYM25785.1 hypothetical protein [Duganella flavida]
MTAILSFLSPLAITPEMLIRSTAVSHTAGELEWSAGTSWAKGAVVFRTPLARRYENLIAGVDTGLPEDTPERWYDLGATDRMTMFDSEVGTQSIADGALTVVFRPGAFNGLFLAGLEGTHLDIAVRDYVGGEVLLNYSGSLEGSQPADYYDWCFAPFRQMTDFIALDIAPYGRSEVSITISYPGSVAKCGIAALGDMKGLGPSLAGLTVEPKSYARITTNSRGETAIRKGKSARDMSISALIPIADADSVVAEMSDVLGVPCVVIASDSTQMQAARVFGLPSGKVTYPGGQYANLSMTVQGMI